MRSFLANGHEFHLYCYEPLSVPKGVILKDANEIVPRAKIADFQNLQNFSDLFCYALYTKKGGWYVGMDTVCLKPFDFYNPYVFYRDASDSITTIAIGKAPKDSPYTKAMFDLVDGMSRETLGKIKYQNIGPDLMTALIPIFGLQDYIQPSKFFDPVRWDNVEYLVNPDSEWDLSEAYAVHLFHGAWDDGCQSQYHKVSPKADAIYPAKCLYEKLKRRYL